MAALVIGGVVFAGCTTSVDKTGRQVESAPLVIHGINPRSTEEVQPFVDAVTKLSNGSMKVEFESNWHGTDAAADTEAIGAVRTGKVDFAVVPVRGWHAAGVSSFDALIAPMEVDSYVLQDAVLRDGIAAQMLAGVEKLGLKGIGILPGPMRKPAGIARDLLTPKDFRGARIAISDGAVADRSIRQLGATPVPSPFAGADMTGFDGMEAQVVSVESNDYDGVVKSVTANVNLWPRPFVVVGTAAAVGALTDDQRHTLTSAAQAAVAPTTALQENDERDSVPVLCARAKLNFLTTNTDQLRAAFAPVIAWLAQDVQTKGFLQRIGQLRAGFSGSSGPTLGCSSATTSTAAKTTATSTTHSALTGPLDGRWEVSYTRAELAAAGAPHWEADDPENSGSFWLEFAAGNFTGGTQGSDATAAGDIVVAGDQLTLNIRTTGEVFRLRWSIYKNTLTFVKIPGSPSPTGFTVKPWKRTSTPATPGPTTG